MPKYYVQSGELRIIILAENSIDACCRAINSIKDTKEIGDTFDVNKTGFESPPDFAFETALVIEVAGWEWE